MNKNEAKRIQNDIKVIKALPVSVWQRSLELAGLPSDLIALSIESRDMTPVERYIRGEIRAINRAEREQRAAEIARAAYARARTFGVEIECVGATRLALVEQAQARGLTLIDEAYNHNERGYAKIVSDSSLCGANANEVVLPPARDFAQLRQICQAIKAAGGYVNRSCGLHVHLDAEGLTPAHIWRIQRNYYYLAAVLSAGTISPSRFLSHYCTLHDAPHAIYGTFEDIHRHNYDRYFAVNTRALRRHGTIEFRQHQGSLNATKIEGWVTFLRNLVEWSESNVLTHEVSRNEAEALGLNLSGLRFAAQAQPAEAV